MKKITLYSNNCPDCKTVKQRLNQSGYSYETVSNMDDILSAAKSYNIFSVPFIIYNNTAYLKNDIDNLLSKIREEV